MSHSQAARLMLRHALPTVADRPPSGHPGNQGRTLYVRLDERTTARVDETAARWGTSRPETVRLLLWVVSEPVARSLSLV